MSWMQTLMADIVNLTNSLEDCNRHCDKLEAENERLKELLDSQGSLYDAVLRREIKLEALLKETMYFARKATIRLVGDSDEWDRRCLLFENVGEALGDIE